MKRAVVNYEAFSEAEQVAQTPEKRRARKVPQLSKGQIDLHKGTGKGAFSLDKALNLYKSKAAR